RTGGNQGKHKSISDSSNISAILNIAVQIFEYTHACQFHSIPEATSILQTKQFALLSSISFLCLLSSTPNTTAVGIELAQEDAECFKTLLAGKETFKEAMHLSRKHGCRKQNAEEEEEAE
ncbi:hypothetical protein L208DRAFT_1236051, partial [Tricholoma matsutake]